MSDTELYDEVKAAFVEAGKNDESTSTSVEALEPAAVVEEAPREEVSKERDETGKFKAQEEPKEAEKPPALGDPAEEAEKPREILSQDKAPSGWTPKARESWATIPENVRAEILRREEDGFKGIRQLQEQMAPYTQFAQNLDPYIKEAFAAKQDPGQYIGRVMEAEKRLRTGDETQRFGALVEIAEGYGIPLRKIINEALGQEVIPHPSLAQQSSNIPAEVQRELEEGRKFREQFQSNQAATDEQKYKAEIDAFKVGKEFFNDVVDDMAALLQTGRAADLGDAYEKACRLNPGVYEILTERASKPALHNKQKAAAKLKGTSSNSAESGNPSDHDDDDDTADTIRKAIAASSGRI